MRDLSKIREFSLLLGLGIVALGCPSSDDGGDAGAGSDTSTGAAADSEGGDSTSDNPSTTGGADTTAAAEEDTSDSDGDPDTTGGGSEGSDSESSGGSGSTGGAVTIPDPGEGSDAWQSMGDITTPEMAWRVGVATQNFPYVEGTAGDTGQGFFVFRAGPKLTELSVFATPNDAGVLTSMHIHDGTGLVFGDEIAADTLDMDGGTWTLIPGNVYVLEVVYPGAGFF